MRSPVQFHENIRSIAVIGNYLPRQCGIATFTADLVEAVSEEAPDIACWPVVMNDKPEGYDYPPKVSFEINQNKLFDYRTAAEFLNINQIDIVCLQHEFGIFGGPAGGNILTLLRNLRMPIITTLHTILQNPPEDYRTVMEQLASLSDRLVVMSQKGKQFLMDIYRIPEEKICFVHHGIPDTPFIDPNFYKDKFGVEGKKVLFTFGLLSPNKGIEYMIKALPEIKKKHPDVSYIILGATHPHIRKIKGEEYRIHLQQLAHSLGVGRQVIFQNRFVDIKELCEFLGTADIYITPYIEEAQITSGTLAYAMGTGKATVSTPYWYAAEMLADGRGRIVPFKNPDALAEQIVDLLSNDTDRHAIRKKAYTFTREAVWKEVARKYIRICVEVKQERERRPQPRYYLKSTTPVTTFELPEIKLQHLATLTDDTGILQHATYNVPNRDHGYCTDDNARALLVATIGKKFLLEHENILDDFISRYLSFLQYAFNEDTGRFRNFMTYSRQWMETYGSEDSHGRSVWGLGKSVAYMEDAGRIAMATTLFRKAITQIEHFTSPRALAFSLVGMHAYLQKFSGDSEVKRAREISANHLFDLFKNNAADDWPWLEDHLTYANGKLPHALLLSGQWLNRGDMFDMGIRALEWLIDIQTENAHFVPIGNNGWYSSDGRRSRFDQQPIEANAMIEACIEAYNVTRERKWIDTAVMCFNWFLGHNDLNMSLYDPKTGGCRDGLMADGVNQNQGAESTLAWLLSLISLHQLMAEDILTRTVKKPSGKTGKQRAVTA